MKVLFFGLGSIGKRHVKILKKYHDVDIYAYRSGEVLSRIPDVTNIYRIDEIDDSFDVVFICNPTFLHVKTALYCFSKGIKNIFIEKPLSNNELNLPALIDCELDGANIYVGHNLRFNEILLELKDFLEIKYIKNNIYYIDVVHSSYLPDWRLNTYYQNSYSASNEMGGGVILDMSHEFDYISWLFGEIESKNREYGQISNLKIDSEDYCDILFKIKSTDIFGRMHLDYFSKNVQRYVNIYHKEGQINMDLIKEEINFFENDFKSVPSYKIRRTTIETAMELSYVKQIEYFMNGVVENKNISNLRENVDLIKKLIEIKFYT
jgi:predicted dehydrogenase